jgi:hypothetical protein
MRMVSVLNYETAGSQRDILKVWGDVVSRLDNRPDNKPRSGALAQAIAREKEPPT